MIEVPLTRGYTALIDDEDAEIVLSHKWCADTFANSRVVYAKTALGKGEGSELLYMHHLVMKCPSGTFLDHINRNGLDNRRSNLRLATKKQNNANRDRQRNNTSGFKGVSWDKERGKWLASISEGGRHRTLGRFQDKSAAALAYDRAALDAFGEFAVLNFPLNSLDPKKGEARWSGVREHAAKHAEPRS